MMLHLDFSGRKMDDRIHAVYARIMLDTLYATPSGQIQELEEDNACTDTNTDPHASNPTLLCRYT